MFSSQTVGRTCIFKTIEVSTVLYKALVKMETKPTGSCLGSTGCVSFLVTLPYSQLSVMFHYKNLNLS